MPGFDPASTAACTPTWHGRRRPGFQVEALASGKKLEDFAVN